MKRYRYLIIVGILAIDQLVKFLIRQEMYVGESIRVIENVFQITYVQNRGAAFSIFMGKSIFLTVVPFVALIVAIWYMERNLSQHWSLTLSLVLIVSGGIGNLLDRMIFGFVTDLFDFLIWPVFNIADIAICVGCGFLIWYMFVIDKPIASEEGKEVLTEVSNESGKDL